MKNSRWQINRVGLVDFWYYDEEEFYFLDGRMLLRGANGSGKSVTMQSFIPLLLDGNMRPERLDPFGSRARKMENYLLEEGDGQEERTGYLFMELKREESDVYLSMGIGMRARRNKKMESWYFCITDGRRIGKDIFLYKDPKNKIACTKQELKNRIGNGGRMLESQGEYAQCVNHYLFGFETQEEYREMLELLIQLRTPKLSKEFKPTVINDILGSSLQTLTEDDLRPMSEAIENMDNLKTNLDTLSESVKAAKQIERVYNQYNELMLYTKAAFFQESVRDCKASEEQQKAYEQELGEKQKSLELENTHYEELVQEEEILKKEKESLSNSDAARLKEQEVRMTEEVQEQSKLAAQKRKQEEEKEERRLEVEEKRKKRAEENEEAWSQIEEELEKMEEEMEEIPFDESKLFLSEIREGKEQTHNFQVHTQLLNEYQRKVEAGKLLLEEEKLRQEKYDRCLQELDECQEKQKQEQRELLEKEDQLSQARGEWIEQLYQWSKENEEILVPKEALSEMVRLVEVYRLGSDFSEVREIARSFYLEKEQEQIREEMLIAQKLEEFQIQLKAAEAEKQEWQRKKDPEPERSEAVKRNRRLLKERNIPYIEFYKAVDFGENLSREQANRLEEALSEMGILDALLVPAQYRREVLYLDASVCDHYLFGDTTKMQNNLSQWLQVDSRGENLLSEEISKMLSTIGIRGGLAWICSDGTYGNGVLEGKVTGHYEAKFIGSSAREAYRQKKIEELEEACEEIQGDISNWEEIREARHRRTEKRKAEWRAFPAEEQLKASAKEYAQKQYDLESVERQIRERKEHTEKERAELNRVRLVVHETCAGTYLTPRLDVFQEALASLLIYRELLMEVKGLHSTYLNGLSYVQAQQEYLEQMEEDLDNLRYEAVRIERKLREAKAQLASIQEQLRLTDYEQIRERLDHCIRRLALLPGERENAIREQSNRRKEMERIQEKKRENEVRYEKLSRKRVWAEKGFDREWKLGYVPTQEALMALPSEKIAEKLVGLLGSRAGKARQNDLTRTLQEVYHQNRASLTEYQVGFETIFQELDEETEFSGMTMTRIDFTSKYRGAKITFGDLLRELSADVEEQGKLLSDKDRELFEDILANTIGKKIRGKIQSSKRWVEKMNELMESMQTSSGLRLSLRWKYKRAEKEEQLDTRELVELLQKDVEIMRKEEVDKLSSHFRSKIAQARKLSDESGSVTSFHAIMKEVLDYRKWFEFQLESQKTGEKKKELTDRVFFTFSGGEKAMSMYVPLFSAVVAKYAGAREDAPRLISLDEAFAGVDETNIRDMFRLMVEFQFNFIINSQILWGDCDTVPAIAIYQLIRPQNAKFVTVIRYKWNGKSRSLVTKWEEE